MSNSGHVVSRRQFWSAPHQPLALTFFLPSLPWCSLSLGVGGVNALFRTEQSTVTHFPCLLYTTHCNKLFWWRAALNYGYQHKHLEDSLITSPFGKTVIVDSPLESITCRAMGCWPGLQCQAWVFSCRTGLTFNQKQVVTAMMVMPLLHQWEYHARVVIAVAHVVHSWCLFSPSILHSTLWCYENSPSGKKLPTQVQLNFSMSEKDLWSSSGGQPRTLAIPCDVLGAEALGIHRLIACKEGFHTWYGIFI